jgi:cell division protease FtsH
MVTEWGMREAIGPMSLNDNAPVFLGDGGFSGKEYSERTAELIDTETRRILMEMEVKCSDLLNSMRGALNLIARSLLEHETVSGAEVDRLIALAQDNPAAASIEPDTVDGVGVISPGRGDDLAGSMVQDSTDNQ